MTGTRSPQPVFLSITGNAGGRKHGSEEGQIPNRIFLSPHTCLGLASISFLSSYTKAQFYQSYATWLIDFAVTSLPAVPGCCTLLGCCVLSPAGAFNAASHPTGAQKE